VPLDPSLPACAGGDCLDLALLETGRRLLEGRDGNLFLVLHQRGQHGPAYFRRYPAEFEKFTPVCRSEDLHDCGVEEVRNAYDNAMLYTDHVLVETIEWLKSVSDRYDTALLYVSDHGESLGENGLFLHGLPYRIAPDVQKHVPMVAWISPGFAASFGMDLAALAAGAGERYSHDNLFHSILGLLEIETSVYERRLDLFATTGASRRAVNASAR
jgi:lipid A ethanolaminephosphotransferase